MFTYYLHAVPKTLKETRKAVEKTAREKNVSIPFPGWEKLQKEEDQEKPQVLLLVSDVNKTPIRWIKSDASKGMHRVNWDLKLAPPDPIDLSQPDFVPPWAGAAEGPLAAPGTYNVQLYILQNDGLKQIASPQEFELKPTPNAPSSIDFAEVSKFQQKTNMLLKDMYSVSAKLGEASNRLRFMKAALIETPKANEQFFTSLQTLNTTLGNLRERLYGNRIKNKFNEATEPSLMSRAGSVAYGHWETRQMPTETHKKNISIAETDFKRFKTDVNAYLDELMRYEAKLEAAGAPYTPSRKLD